MNPKLTITVDEKNRATAVMEGVVSVGAKVDVVLKGLTSDIPAWDDDDGFVGPSLRFRVVDECGHDLVRYPLEETDFWSTTGTGVYESATAVDFDTDALRHIFEGVIFNDTLEFGVVLDSVVDAAEYGTGRLKIQQWSVASTEDPTVLPDWRETLAKLKENLEDVKENVVAAEAARDAAEGSAGSAESAASAAATSATAAETAQDSARASELNAAKSEAAAEKAQAAAEAARDAAEGSAGSAESAASAAATSAAEAAESAKKSKDTAAEVAADLAAHKADTSNPHAVTAEQVGAYSKTKVDEKIEGAGKVKSVNGKEGVVVLTAEDVGALPATKDETTGEYKVADSTVFKKKITIEQGEDAEDGDTEDKTGIGICAFDSTTERGVEIFDASANKSSALVPDGTPFVTAGTIKTAAYQFPTFTTSDTVKTIIEKLQQVTSILQGIGD